MAPVPFSPIKIGKIDDVQELRKVRPTSIPERFVRDMVERPFVASPSMHIPVIDLSKLIEGVEPHFIRNPKLWPTNPANFSETLEMYSANIRGLCKNLLKFIAMNDTWIPVQPVPNALVINIGDTLEVLTNGKYKSVEHRAVTHKHKDRLSIVTFYAPSYEIDLGPLPQLIDENRPCMYKNYNHGEYSKHYVTNKLQGKKTLEFAKIQQKLST
ncbi:Dmr6-like oxygenase [Thalictrum thalictroides]|uniref:Dmr6-like oxygenase n=1 Tax=Thalictrum thalictroides TaxID=46969 RepID=A0A7J6XD14_THATH|nr:Dmr6-like oxygenase [Thalictrum thalictroides]